MSTELTCWNLAEIAVNAGAPRILLHGPKGLAKSRFAQDILAASHEGVSQCSLNEDIAVQELIGHYIPKGVVFDWHDGPVMRAYRHGHGLIVNELGRASGAVQDMFLGVLDDPTVSMYTLPTGENVRPGESFQVIATSNTSPDTLDEALHDRFDSIIKVDRPHPKLIDHLNEKIPGMGVIIARSYSDPKRAISPRRALAFISYVAKGVDESVAAQLAFAGIAKDVLIALKSLAATASAGVI